MKTRILAAVAAGAVLAGGAAEAEVTYSFESSDGAQAFIWTSPTFVGPADANVYVPNLDSCTATPIPCYGVRFISDTSPSFGPTDDHDRLYFITGDDPLFINQYLFADGAFAAVGVYDTLRGGDAGQLTVSAGVPEPAAWATMVLGFGGLGAALRRRRVAAAA